MVYLIISVVCLIVLCLVGYIVHKRIEENEDMHAFLSGIVVLVSCGIVLGCWAHIWINTGNYFLIAYPYFWIGYLPAIVYIFWKVLDPCELLESEEVAWALVFSLIPFLNQLAVVVCFIGAVCCIPGEINKRVTQLREMRERKRQHEARADASDG